VDELDGLSANISQGIMAAPAVTATPLRKSRRVMARFMPRSLSHLFMVSLLQAEGRAEAPA
jgi:hypothetical protein